MLDIGLTPSSTRKPGGKMTGDHMADYPTTKGRFLTSVDALQKQGFKISFYDRLDELMSEKGNCCLVFTPKLNEWNGQRNVEMEVNDLRAGHDPQLA